MDLAARTAHKFGNIRGGSVQFSRIFAATPLESCLPSVVLVPGRLGTVHQWEISDSRFRSKGNKHKKKVTVVL